MTLSGAHKTDADDQNGFDQTTEATEAECRSGEALHITRIRHMEKKALHMAEVLHKPRNVQFGQFLGPQPEGTSSLLGQGRVLA